MKENIINVETVEFVDFSGESSTNSAAYLKQDVTAVSDLKLNLTALLGIHKTTLGKIEAYKKGDILEVERMTGHNVDIFIGKEKIAIGEVVIAEDNFGISITEIHSKNGEFLKNGRRTGEL